MDDDQLDLSLDLDLHEYRASARSALKRVTAKELAYLVHLDHDSVNNQFREWNKRKQPSAITAFMLEKHDEQHLREKVSLFGKVIGSKPVQGPEESLRELEARAAKGYVSADELRQVLSRTRRNSAESDGPPGPAVRGVPR